MNWLERIMGRRRQHGQSCETCRHFIDHRDLKADPPDTLGYCGYLVDTLGLDGALRVNEYGGHWTDQGDWCRKWEGGEPIWK